MPNSLPLSPIPQARFQLRGVVGQRLAANLEQWLLVAPQANPAMLEMLRDRDRATRRDLVPWACEFAGKYLTAATACYRLDRDERLRAQLDRFVDEFIRCQAPDGYLGPFPQAERLTGTTINGQDKLWDVWGHYHAILGLLAWFRETKYQPALAACRRAADYLCARFLDGSERVRDAGAEEMNQAIAHGLLLLYQETSEPRYLQLAREVEADWRTPPSGDWMRQALADVPFYRTPKPRWESLHDIQAILSFYEITGDDDYRRAFEQIWRTIRDGDRHNTGGFSSGEQATGDPYDPRAIETCCTVAWMALSVDMLRLTGDPTVADELELSLYNGALGAQTPSGRWWTYNTPMAGVRKASAHEIVFQAREGAPELNCCSVNGPRSLGLLADWAVMSTREGEITLNYYGSGAIAVPLDGEHAVRLIQHTEYPVQGHVSITLELARPQRFALRLRIPAWSRQTRCAVNGAPVAGIVAGSYLRLERDWWDGDRIALNLDFTPRIWLGEREAAGKASVYRGPLLLAYDRRYNPYAPDDCPAVDLAHLEGELSQWHGGYPAPWLLYRLTAADGRTLTLCDFATAGMAGGPYRTWLNCAAATKTIK